LRGGRGRDSGPKETEELGSFRKGLDIGGKGAMRIPCEGPGRQMGGEENEEKGGGLFVIVFRNKAK